MRRAASLIGALVLLLGLAPGRAAAEPVTTTLAPSVGPAAWVLVDVDTGRVVAAHDEHERRRPGSMIKLLTLLTARRLLPADGPVPVSKLAASMPPRRVGLVPGETWSLSSLIDAMLLVSANDAAVAVAERAAGSLDRFALEMQREGARLGLVDTPQLEDPTGLDHTFDHDGGDWISAWDLALVARQAMHDTEITSVASMKALTITGPSGRLVQLHNRNQLLESYPGATGLKTGFTHAAGKCLVATAVRDGRTMLAVVMGSHNLYVDAGRVLDQGFATPVSAESGRRLSGRDEPTTTTTTAVAPPRSRPSSTPVLRSRMVSSVVPPVVLSGAAVGVALGARRRRRRDSSSD